MSKVSIVIINWNGLKHLPECLQSIKDQTFKDFEVIIIDNGSTDGSISFIRESYSDYKIIKNPRNYGFCRSANQGINAAQGELLLLLNNDTRCDNKFLENIVNCWASVDNSVIAIFPKSLYYDKPNIINSAGVKWTKWGFWQTYSDGLADSTTCIEKQYVFGDRFIAPCFDRKKLIEIGMFDEDFFSYHEDFDVSYRANVLGYKFVICPNAVIFHKMSQALIDNNINETYKLKLGLRNYFYVIIKNYELKNLFLYAPWFLIKIYLYHGLYSSIRKYGWKKTGRIFAIIISSLTQVINNASSLMSKRKIIQLNRKIGDEKIWQ